MPLFLGVDLGTQGVRVLCVDHRGRSVASGVHMFADAVTVQGLPDGWREQNPDYWWQITAQALTEVVKQLKNKSENLRDIIAVSVDSTSGTVMPIDANGNVLRPALMYNDARAQSEAAICNQNGRELCEKLGYKFAASFALPKILWMMNNEQEIIKKTYKIIHAADFIVGKLTGDYTVSDYSNALKTGYDLMKLAWPEFIDKKLGVEINLLPEVARPGERIGVISSECSDIVGLPVGCRVVAGVTDGTAGFLASGASQLGEWNSTLGTTLVIRGVSDKLIEDPLGRLYCHLSPDGYWLPGAAGNVGGECLAKHFPDVDYSYADQQALRLSPTGVSVYPLVRKGERFPFVDPKAEGFVSQTNLPEDLLYTAYLEGVACVERWSYEAAHSLGAKIGDYIYTTGGGAKSIEWMQIRADLLQKELIRPANPESAMGAAVLAASGTFFGSCSEAVKNMVIEDIRVAPRHNTAQQYADIYAKFRCECAARGLGEKSKNKMH